MHLTYIRTFSLIADALKWVSPAQRNLHKSWSVNHSGSYNAEIASIESAPGFSGWHVVNGTLGYASDKNGTKYLNKFEIFPLVSDEKYNLLSFDPTAAGRQEAVVSTHVQGHPVEYDLENAKRLGKKFGDYVVSAGDFPISLDQGKIDTNQERTQLIKAVIRNCLSFGAPVRSNVHQELSDTTFQAPEDEELFTLIEKVESSL